MELQLVTPPAVEPLSLTEAKSHTRVVWDAEDTDVAAYIKAARVHAEAVTRRAFVQQVWDVFYDAFPGDSRERLELPLPPVVSVDSVKYTDTAGVLQTWDPAEYQAVLPGGEAPPPATLVPKYADGYGWPSPKDQPQAVVVRLTCGYGVLGSDVPEPIRQAMRVHVARMYELRDEEAAAPERVGRILYPFRLLEV